MSNLDLHRQNVEEAHRAHDVLRAHRRAFNEAAVKSGEVILRTCLLINGGAAIAVLAFMGNVIAKDPSSHRLLADCLRRAERLLFWVGFAVIAMGLMGGRQDFDRAPTRVRTRRCPLPRAWSVCRQVPRTCGRARDLGPTTRLWSISHRPPRKEGSTTKENIGRLLDCSLLSGPRSPSSRVFFMF